MLAGFPRPRAQSQASEPECEHGFGAQRSRRKAANTPAATPIPLLVGQGTPWAPLLHSPHVLKASRRAKKLQVLVPALLPHSDRRHLPPCKPCHCIKCKVYTT